MSVVVYICLVNLGGCRFEIQILIVVLCNLGFILFIVIGFVFDVMIDEVIIVFVKDFNDILVDMIFRLEILSRLLGFK